MFHQNEDDYICSLDDKTIKKAREELNEYPEKRLQAVKTLRKWIKEQPHIKCPVLDTHMLLMFLRGAKFNQERAQKMVVGNFKMKSEAPEWFLDLDAFDPDTQKVLDTGYIVPLPHRTEDGSAILIYRLGAINSSDHPKEAIMRAGIVVGAAMSQSEMTQVNGTVFIFDFTDVSSFGMPGMDRHDMVKWHRIWQKNIPGRFKTFHFYNGGLILNLIMRFSKLFLSKKYQERVIVHSTKEGLVKDIASELLPEEYLPEGHTGAHCGSIPQLIETFKEEYLTPEFRSQFLYKTSNAFRVENEPKG